jgi:CheY-like chemotaxis protein
VTADNIQSSLPSVLIVDGDIVSRHAIADYLRHCSYAVVEAANLSEAYVALEEPTLSIDVILCDVSSLGSQSGFELAAWVRANRPELEVRLAGGAHMAAQTAAQLCEAGPQLRRPYDFNEVVAYITRLRSSRLAR